MNITDQCVNTKSLSLADFVNSLDTLRLLHPQLSSNATRYVQQALFEMMLLRCSARQECVQQTTYSNLGHLTEKLILSKLGNTATYKGIVRNFTDNPASGWIRASRPAMEDVRFLLFTNQDRITLLLDAAGPDNGLSTSYVFDRDAELFMRCGDMLHQAVKEGFTL